MRTFLDFSRSSDSWQQGSVCSCCCSYWFIWCNWTKELSCYPLFQNYYCCWVQGHRFDFVTTTITSAQQPFVPMCFSIFFHFNKSKWSIEKKSDQQLPSIASLRATPRRSSTRATIKSSRRSMNEFSNFCFLKSSLSIHHHFHTICSFIPTL